MGDRSGARGGGRGASHVEGSGAARVREGEGGAGGAPGADDDAQRDARVAEALAGGREAQDEVLAALRPLLLRRVEDARRRRNWFWLDDPEEVVQEAAAQLLAAWRGGKFAYEGWRRLEGFAVRTAFFVAMNRKDRAARARAFSLHDPEDGGLRFDVAAFAASVDEDLDRRRCLELLARAIAGLNENRREVVERTLLGQKVREICAETGRSAASVSGLKFNALLELRRALDGVEFARRCGELFGLGGPEQGGLAGGGAG